MLPPPPAAPRALNPTCGRPLTAYCLLPTALHLLPPVLVEPGIHSCEGWSHGRDIMRRVLPASRTTLSRKGVIYGLFDGYALRLEVERAEGADPRRAEGDRPPG